MLGLFFKINFTTALASQLQAKRCAISHFVYTLRSHGIKYPFKQVSTRSFPIMLTLYNLFYSVVDGVLRRD